MTQPALERVLAQAEAGMLRRAGGREEAPEETLARLAGDFGAAEATEVLAGFLEEGRAAAAAMQDATAAGDDAGMALAARGLREAADTLGLGALGALAAAAESADAVQRAAAVSALEAALEAYAIGFAQAVRA
jgi:HPt (histidine-containing phosphotransfer) domain-containing protein